MIEIGTARRGGSTCVVMSPDRVYRVWALLHATDDELRRDGAPRAAPPGMREVLAAAHAEMRKAESPPLRAELRHLLGHSVDEPSPDEPSPDELRTELTALMGWIDGLVAAMTREIERAARGAQRPADRLVTTPSRASAV